MEAESRATSQRAFAERTAPFLGYGSLVSGLGLRGLQPLPVRQLARVRLLGCRRGFGKPSQYGDRLAMLLEPLHTDEPIRARSLDDDVDEAARAPEALLMVVSVDDLARVARREGYRSDALIALDLLAAKEDSSLPEFLWDLLAAAGFDYAAYRGELARRVAYTSPHYIPHPVPLEDGSTALTFLAPGREGSGNADVIPVRVAAGMTDLLSMAAAWREKPNPSQIEYFLMCLLAAVHNLSLEDVLDGLEEESELCRILAELGPPEADSEPERFRAALCLTPAEYARRLGRGPRRSYRLTRYVARAGEVDGPLEGVHK